MTSWEDPAQAISLYIALGPNYSLMGGPGTGNLPSHVVSVHTSLRMPVRMPMHTAVQACHHGTSERSCSMLLRVRCELGSYYVVLCCAPAVLRAT